MKCLFKRVFIVTSLCSVLFFNISAGLADEALIARGRAEERHPAQFQHPAQFHHPDQAHPYHPAAHEAARQDVNRAAETNALESGAVGGAVYPVAPVYPTTPANAPNPEATINVNPSSQSGTSTTPQH